MSLIMPITQLDIVIIAVHWYDRITSDACINMFILWGILDFATNFTAIVVDCIKYNQL